MRKATLFVVAAVAMLGADSPAFAEVQLSMQNGHVTIVAKDATVRQILLEWARVGQTKIVNVERIPGGPMTIELRDVPEEQALRVLLRSLSGFMTASRTIISADASVFDRIIVMPTMAAASAPLSAAPPPVSVPTFFPPPAATLPEEADDQRPAGAAAAPASPLNRGPVFVFPQPVTTTPPAGGAQTVPATAPAASPPAAPAVVYPGGPAPAGTVGVSVPGMIVPAPPPQPGQPGQPQP